MNAGLKKVTKQESAVRPFCFDFGVSLNPMLKTKPGEGGEKERKEAMQTDRDEIPERGKKLLQVSINQSFINIHNTIPNFSSVPKTHSIKKCK